MYGVSMLGFGWVDSAAAATAYSCVAAGFLEAGYALIHLYVPEVFPTELRATASGVVNAVSSVLSMSVPFITAALLDKGSANTAILFFAAEAFIGAILTTLLLTIETKGRALEDSAE